MKFGGGARDKSILCDTIFLDFSKVFDPPAILK